MSVRRTKIVATLGPASNSPEVLEQLILAGLDVARLNFSHGTPDEHKARAKLVRDLAAKHGRFVALLGDLQGPKIRIAKFANKKIELKIGDQFTFSTSHPLTEGTQTVVGIDYPDLVKDCGVGDELLLDDGRVVMRVDTATATELNCTVTDRRPAVGPQRHQPSRWRPDRTGPDRKRQGRHQARRRNASRLPRRVLPA